MRILPYPSVVFRSLSKVCNWVFCFVLFFIGSKDPLGGEPEVNKLFEIFDTFPTHAMCPLVHLGLACSRSPDHENRSERELFMHCLVRMWDEFVLISWLPPDLLTGGISFEAHEDSSERLARCFMFFFKGTAFSKFALIMTFAVD